MQAELSGEKKRTRMLETELSKRTDQVQEMKDQLRQLRDLVRNGSGCRMMRCYDKLSIMTQLFATNVA